jgi:hypothetical protein
METGEHQDMTKYNVYVQDKFYKVFEMEFVNDILTQVNEDISNNLVSGYDPNQPSNIKIQPV